MAAMSATSPTVITPSAIMTSTTVIPALSWSLAVTVPMSLVGDLYPSGHRDHDFQDRCVRRVRHCERGPGRCAEIVEDRIGGGGERHVVGEPIESVGVGARTDPLRRRRRAGVAAGGRADPVAILVVDDLDARTLTLGDGELPAAIDTRRQLLGSGAERGAAPVREER